MSEVERAAFREAERLGHHWIGPEHGLLAILRGDPEDPGRLGLEQAGMQTEMVERLLERMIASDPRAAPEPARGVSPNPAWYRVAGRAEGFGAGIGTGELRPVDLLLAVLWDSQWHFRQEVAREAVTAALARLGVTLPPTPLPELDRQPRFTQHVEFPLSKLDRVIPLLVERHPPGSGPTYGFNHDGAERGGSTPKTGATCRASSKPPSRTTSRSFTAAEESRAACRGSSTGFAGT